MSEYAEMGSVFLSLGGMCVLLMICYFIYQLTRMWKNWNDVEDKYSLYEMLVLDKVAIKKGIDLKKESMKRDLFERQKRSFRGRLREEMITEMFGKDKEE